MTFREVRKIESLDTMLAAVAFEGWVGYAGEPGLRLRPAGIVTCRLEPDSMEMPIILAWKPESSTAGICEILAGLLVGAGSALRGEPATVNRGRSRRPQG